MKKLLLFLLVGGLGGGGYYYHHTYLSASFLRKKTVTICEKERDVLPLDDVEKRGLKLRMVPNKDNAAILYCHVTNTVPTPNHDARDALAGRRVDDPAFKRWFKRNEKDLELLHKATTKPDCQFPILGTKDDLIGEFLLPHLQAMRLFARMLSCEGLYHEQDGQWSEALDSYLAIHRLAKHISDSDCCMMSKLVVIACHAIGCKATDMWLANGRPAEADLRAAVSGYLDVLEEMPSITDTLSFERLMTEEFLETAFQNPGKVTEFYAQFATEAELRRALDQYGNNREALSRDADRLWKDFERWCKLPAWQALSRNGSWDAYVNRTPQLQLLNKFMTAALHKAKKHFARCEAQLGGVAIFAAIKLYEKKNGRPPAALSELEGDYISELPKDPFSGRDYVYRVRGNDWILYSVWDNLTDDNGAGSWPHKYKEDKDFIWRNTPIPIEPRGR